MGDDLRTELNTEYFHLQDTYEEFDKRALTIKGWVSAAAVTGASLGVNKDREILPEISIIVAVVLLSIWCLEAYWKMFQYGFRDRIRTLEAYFRNDADITKPYAPFQIYHSWFDCHVHDTPIFAYEEKFRPRNVVLRFASVMCHPFVFLPYLPLLVICLAYYPNCALSYVAAALLILLFALGTTQFIATRRNSKAASRREAHALRRR